MDFWIRTEPKTFIIKTKKRTKIVPKLLYMLNPPNNTPLPPSMITNSKRTKIKVHRFRNSLLRILSITTAQLSYFTTNHSTPCNLYSFRFINLQQTSFPEDSPPFPATVLKTNQVSKTWVNGQLLVVYKMPISQTKSLNSRDVPVLTTTHFFDIYNCIF